MQLAMVAPDDIETISEAELITGYHVEPVVALEAPVQAALDRGFDERIVARQTIVDMKMADLEAAEDAVEEELSSRRARGTRTSAGRATGARDFDGRHQRQHERYPP